jgi:hypothetical protein
MTTTEQTFPKHLQTEYSEVELRCPVCKALWSPPVTRFVNLATDPHAIEGMLRRSVHHAYCPACKYHYEVEQIFSIYDPAQGLIVQARPKWEFNAGGGEEIYWKRLEDLVLKHATDDVRVVIVFGWDELIEKYLGGKDAEEAALVRREQEREQDLEPGSLAPRNAGLQPAATS